MYRQGDILLIPIPFSDLKSNKKRPVLVLSNTKYNLITEDIVVAAITSNLESKEYSIIINNDDLQEGEIKVTSSIRADKIYTLSHNIVIKKIGSVNIDVIEKVRNVVGLLLKE
ncbi:MAG: type II toxin-antitoxin system PemK/MazF family toxin [Caloramator sp.]|nr:type II toxin-antitoxin system PemK/MazF family toxin [Caloramator sp.]